MLQQKCGSRVGCRSRIVVGTRSSQARVGIETQSFTGLRLKLKQDLD